MGFCVRPWFFPATRTGRWRRRCAASWVFARARRWSARFSDGEVQVEIEENVRRQEVFVIQPTNAPTAENFMELLVLIDALKRASAASVTAVVPYFGYARQDRRPRSARVPITAKVAAKMIGRWAPTGC
jgi:phosphoribosylpyrophosphate synthetase